MLKLTFLQKTILMVTIPATAYLLSYLLFKDDEEEDDDLYNDRIVTSRQTVIPVKVKKAIVGKIIGQQGCNIKKIQEESGARINFKDAPADDLERELVIRGSLEAAQKAELIIRKMIADEPEMFVEEIFVPQRALGRIIGRGGENIRQLSRGCKAKVDIDRVEGGEPSAMRSIKIKGPRDSIQNAKAMIEEMVKEDNAFRSRSSVSATQRSHRTSKHQHDNSTQHNQGTQLSIPETMAWPDHHGFIECYVSAIENPSHFWVQILRAESRKLDDMTKEMTEYYTQGSLENPSIESLHPGMLVAAAFSHDVFWYRAQVVKVLDNGMVDLYYVDYGDNDVISVQNVRTLSSHYYSLPFQAIECLLADVQVEDGQWSDDACSVFEELTYCAKWKVIMARIEAYVQMGDSDRVLPQLTLFDTHGVEDVNICKELVRLGYAAHTKKNDISKSKNIDELDKTNTEHTNCDTGCVPILNHKTGDNALEHAIGDSLLEYETGDDKSSLKHVIESLQETTVEPQQNGEHG